jgi:protein-disulfide isomerase-like protein with CxxC motif
LRFNVADESLAPLYASVQSVPGEGDNCRNHPYSFSAFDELTWTIHRHAESSDAAIDAVEVLPGQIADRCDSFCANLSDRGAVFDSEPPIEAILAAEQLGGRGLDMLKRIQRAHYVEGRRVADRGVLVGLAADIGLPEATLKPMLEKVAGPAAAKHIAASRDLLRRVGGQGFPTFVFDAGRGLETLDAARYFGRVPAWEEALVERVSASQASART